MGRRITSIRAYSERDGLAKVSALTGDYDDDADTVTVNPPYELHSGGPVNGEPFTIGCDDQSGRRPTPLKIKRVAFAGMVAGTQKLLFQ